MKFIDAFAGIGGFRMAMEHFNHECVQTIEYDTKAQKAYTSIWGKGNDWFDDIRNLKTNDIPDFDVLCGGFPCAKFSVAGDRKGFQSDDPRAFMFFELARIARDKKPKYLLFENVKGLLNHDNGRSFAIIINTLDQLGYDAEWQLINAKDFGYPILRERVFIVGHLRGANTKEIFPITGISEPDVRESQRADRKGTIRLTKNVYQYRRGHFRRFKGYCPTLTASMGTGGNNVPFVKENGGLRKLTPRELFKLQGIDDMYIDRLINSGLPDSALYERAGRTIFIPFVKEIVKRMN